jgi:hypothetical protein
MVKVGIRKPQTNESVNTLIYQSLDEFINNFPFAERQCKNEIEHDLEQKGRFIFSDSDCPHQYILTIHPK